MRRVEVDVACGRCELRGTWTWSWTSTISSTSTATCHVIRTGAVARIKRGGYLASGAYISFTYWLSIRRVLNCGAMVAMACFDRRNHSRDRSFSSSS